jgi:N-acetylglucosaminyldiphosphoundecaprenol N-acetyl-beta-D-mannosaminyltransferase
MNSVHILGVRVDDVTMDAALESVAQFMQEPRLHQIASVNPEFIMAARRNPEFARVLEENDLNLPDGANLIRASRFLRKPLRQRVAGSDLIWHLGERAAQEGWRIFFLGAREGVAEQASEKLLARYPRLQIAGVYAGSPQPRHDAEQVGRVIASGAQILFVAYGAPAQDLWIARNRTPLSGSVRVAMGVGGAFDFIAGRVPRAPMWMQSAGLEWLFRLIQEPRRWRRQLALVEFTWQVLRARRRRSSNKGNS